MEITIQTLAQIAKDNKMAIKYDTTKDKWYIKDLNNVCNNGEWELIGSYFSYVRDIIMERMLTSRLTKDELSSIQRGTGLIEDATPASPERPADVCTKRDSNINKGE